MTRLRILTRARRPVSYTLAVLVTATAAVAAAATPAAAAPTGAVITTASVSIPPLGAASAVVTCPAGKTAIGGGFTRAEGITVPESRPLDAQWAVLGWNTSSRAATLIAYAVCATVESGGRTIRNATAVIQPNSAGTVTAKCPSGRRLVGGGFLLDEFPDTSGIPADRLAGVVPYWNLPDPDTNSWTVQVVNLSTSTRLAGAYAVCSTPASSVAVTVSDMLPPREYKALDAICPAGTIASGAGWAYGGTGVRLERTLMPRGTTANPTVPRGWTAYFLNAHAQGQIQVVARAVCIPAA